MRLNGQAIRPVVLMLMATVCLVALTTQSFAEEQYTGYDAIVKNLSGASTTAAPLQTDGDSLDTIQFHAGFGAVMSHLNLSGSGLPSNADLHGYQINMGIDLLSPYWQAVGTITSFDPDTSHQAEIQMKEFGLLVQHEMPIQHSVDFIFEAGLTARYLALSGDIPSASARERTTPASLLDGGLNFDVTSGFGIRLDASYQAPMVHATADAGSIDGTLMFAGSF